MVFDASDLGAGGQGFADDASSAIPQDDPTLIPDGSDGAVPSDLGIEDAAASAIADDEVVEDDPHAQLRQEIEQQVRESILTAEQAKFNENLRRLQSVKDQEVKREREQVQRLMAREAAREQWLAQYFQQNELDPRDLDVLENRLNRADQHYAQQAQVSEQGFQQWATGSLGNMARFLDTQSKDDAGQQLFDPRSDAELNRLTQSYLENARRYHMTQDDRYLQAFNQTFNQHKERVYKLREAAIKQGLAQQRQRNVAQQQKARAVQQQRGRQATGAGAGAGPLTGEQIMKQAESIATQRGLDLNKDYSEVFNIYMTLKNTQT